MIIHLSPRHQAERYTASISGDVLTIDGGAAFDFTPLGEGMRLPGDAIDSPWIIGAERIGGDLHITLILPIGIDASAAARFPQPIAAAPGDLELPQ